MSPAVRVLGAVVLVAALAGLCLHYGATWERHSPYPKDEELVENYDAHVGKTVFVFGTVLSVDESANEATVEVDSNVGPIELQVTGFTESAEPGGIVQVYGALKAGNRIDATTVEVVNPAGSSKLYKYGVSVIGAGLVVALFLRTWRFDPDSLEFEVRTDG